MNTFGGSPDNEKEVRGHRPLDLFLLYERGDLCAVAAESTLQVWIIFFRAGQAGIDHRRNCDRVDLNIAFELDLVRDLAEAAIEQNLNRFMVTVQGPLPETADQDLESLAFVSVVVLDDFARLRSNYGAEFRSLLAASWIC